MSSHLYACRLLRYHRLKDFNRLRCSMNIKEQVKSQINFQDTQLTYYDMNKLASLLDKDLSVLPFSIRVLLENLIPSSCEIFADPANSQMRLNVAEGAAALKAVEN